MAVQFSNNAATNLSAAISASATSITVADASEFPTLSGSDYTYVTLSNLLETTVEVVKVTAISGNTLTVVRGQDNTTAAAFASGDKCELRVTAALLNDVAEQADTNTEYTAGSGITLTGTTFSNSAPDQTVSLTGSGATSVSGTYPNFTVSSTDTNTTYSVGDGGLTQNNFTNALKSKLDGVEASADVTDTANVVDALTAGTNVTIALDGTISSTDTNTTYTAGTNLSLSGTTFNLNTNLSGLGTISSGAITSNGTVIWQGGSSTNANTAYGWGNHASAGYLTDAGAELTAFPTDTDATSSDLVPYYDVSAGRWEKGTIANVALQGPQGPAGADGSPDTAAQVLAKIVTVDGSGSGLDADLLDGYHLSTTRNSANTVPVRDGNGYLHLGWINTTSGATTSTIDKIYASNDNFIRYVTPATFKSQLGLWHAGNDGSGSGLDADTVDGQHESTFMRRSANSTLNMNNREIYGVNNLRFNDPGVNEGIKWDGGSLWQIYESPDAQSNGSGNLQFTSGSGNGTRRMTLSTSGSLYTSAQGTLWGNSNDGSGSGLDADTVDGIHATNLRSINSEYTGSVSSAGWYTIAEYGSGRAQGEFHVFDLDSGRHNYVKLNVVWSYGKGGITCTANGKHGLLTIYHARLLYNTSDQTYGGCKLQIYCVNPSWTLRVRQTPGQFSGWGGFTQTTISKADSVSGFAEHSRASSLAKQGGFSTSGETWLAAGHKVWHAGNDGSGSGLDADLLDGIDSSQFVYGDGPRRTYNQNPNTAINSGFYDQYNSNTPTGTWYSFITMAHTNTANGHGHQIAGSFYSDGDLYNRHYDGGTSPSFGNWTRIWNAANDGSGSGLDADLLDGLQLNSTTTNSQANKVVRTDGNGYANFGWINTTSGSIGGSAIDRVYSSYDGYIRYSPASNFLHRQGISYYRAYDWLEFRDTGAGLYWSNSTGSGWHIYPQSTSYMRFRSGNSGSGGIRCNTAGSDRNYIYWNSSNEVGFLTSFGGWAFKCDNSGNVTATGNVTAYSDIRLKTDIEPIEGALDRVSKLEGVEYTRTSTGEREIGFIAQDVITHEPTLVDVVDASTEEQEALPDLHVMKYQNTTALLVEAVKELKTEVDTLRQEIAELKKES